MVLFLSIAILILLTADTLLTAVLVAKTVGKGRRPAKEAKETFPAEPPEDGVKESPIDEGFENIMRFQVKGKSGFEREGDTWQ